MNYFDFGLWVAAAAVVFLFIDYNVRLFSKNTVADNTSKVCCESLEDIFVEPEEFTGVPVSIEVTELINGTDGDLVNSGFETMSIRELRKYIYTHSLQDSVRAAAGNKQIGRLKRTEMIKALEELECFIVGV